MKLYLVSIGSEFECGLMEMMLSGLHVYMCV